MGWYKPSDFMLTQKERGDLDKMETLHIQFTFITNHKGDDVKKEERESTKA